MPEICRFYGIIIRMNYNDHDPPHFHAYSGEFAAVVDIQGQQVIGGRLPPRALGMVLEWTARHQSASIDPLD